MLNLLKKLAAKLPLSMQQELKRFYFAQQIRRGRFFTNEIEFALLDAYLSPGDWVLDIGANVGHYTRKLSDLVGPTGRVIALEPVPRTFELLAANVQHFSNQNVTLFNVAASERCGAIDMEIPSFGNGITNFYQARLSSRATDLRVLTIPVDALALPHPVRLVKMDTEGHEPSVLRGMKHLLERDRPVLIVEASSPSIVDYLGPFGYEMKQLENSSNYLFCHPTTTIVN